MRRALPLLLAAGALPLWLPTAATASVAPLPPSDYQTHQVCPAPAPRHASCLAVELLPRTAAARAHTHPLGMTRDAPLPRAGEAATVCKPPTAAEGCYGLRPQDLRSAYFPGEQPHAPASEPQTIALVDAYDDSKAEADLGVYDSELGLPACTEANKCFRKVNQQGAAGPLPATHSTAEKEAASGWALEISTDIEIAHGVCQNCRILLVEANSAEYPELEAAEEAAVALGATEVSNSWGGEEPLLESPAFEHPKTVITAAAGDDGYLNWTEAEESTKYYAGADYPASSPNVVAVGGTELTLTATGARQSETVWNEDPDPEGGNEGAGGGGCSTRFEAPEWQQEIPDWTSVGCGVGAEAKRAVADVAADADPYTGVAIYDSVPYYEAKGRPTLLDWVPIGGTSVASPIIASLFALAGGAHEVAYPARTLYAHLGHRSLYDVTTGGNGRCDGLYASGCSGSLEATNPLFPFDCGAGMLICSASEGYDGPTGVGAPNGIAAFTPESEAEHAQKVEAEKEAEERRASEESQQAEEKAAEEQRILAEEKRTLEEEQAEEAKRKLAEAARAGERKTMEGTTQSSSGASSISSSGLVGHESSGSSHAASNPGGAVPSAIRLSHLALTARASAVIARDLPTLAQLAFAFTLSAPARVRVTLSREVRVRGRPSWASAGTVTLTAAGGRDRDHLQGRRTLLAPGRYRLTLTPAHGGARSIVFVLR